MTKSGASAIRIVPAPLSPDDAEALSVLHRRAFSGPEGRWGRGWSAKEILSLANSPGALLLAAGPTVAPRGLALIRVAADEAELLTIATDPTARRGGIARSLLKATQNNLRDMDVSVVFLEVGSKNSAAIALYTSVGFQQVAIRADYYAFSDGERDDALIYRQKFN